jgi:hypothetical protein
MRSFRQACAAYQHIVASLPTHRLAESELSRVTFSACGVDAGVCKYALAQQDMARAHESILSPESLLALPQTDSPDLVVTSRMIEEVACLECESNEYQQKLLSLEGKAKSWKPWRPRAAIGPYQTLISMDRINEEAAFDLAQVHGRLNATCAAVRSFDRLLEVNPCHTEALGARARACLEMGQQSVSRVRLFDQRGRDGLASISRLRLETSGRTPLGDEDEYLNVGYAHQFLTTEDGNHIGGDIALIGADWKPSDYTRLFTHMELARYDEGLATRPLFKFGAQRTTCADVSWQCTGFLENVLENGESIAQDIHRYGVTADVRRMLNWRWRVAGAYRWADYSDDNTLHEFSISSNYLHCYGGGRRQLRSLIDFNFSDYSEQSLFGPVPGDLRGMIHPYFAPQSFGYLSIG